MRHHRPLIPVNPHACDTRAWKAVLPTLGDAVVAPTLVTVSAECGYEKYAIAVPLRAWQQIVRGELLVLKRLVPVGESIVPYEWHFNRYQRGNLFVDWGHGDLRFWIGLEAVDLRLGEQALLWEPEQLPVLPLRDAPRAFFKTLWNRCRQLWAFHRRRPYRAHE